MRSTHHCQPDVGTCVSEHGDRLRAWVPPRLAPIVAPVLGLAAAASRYTLVSALALVLDFAVYLLLATAA